MSTQPTRSVTVTTREWDLPAGQVPISVVAGAANAAETERNAVAAPTTGEITIGDVYSRTDGDHMVIGYSYTVTDTPQANDAPAEPTDPAEPAPDTQQ